VPGCGTGSLAGANLATAEINASDGDPSILALWDVVWAILDSDIPGRLDRGVGDALSERGLPREPVLTRWGGTHPVCGRASDYQNVPGTPSGLARLKINPV